jgi:hypothetical protein
LPDEEWLYFADPNVDRSLFLVNHQLDVEVDSYFPLGSGAESMTVFGFGRQNLDSHLSFAPGYFTIGLMDQTDFITGAQIIRSSYKELTVTPGAAEQREALTLTTGLEGQGQVVQTPDQGTFPCNQVVQLTAAPADGWQFDSWNGDLSGNVNPATLTITSSRVITANFSQISLPAEDVQVFLPVLIK